MCKEGKVGIRCSAPKEGDDRSVLLFRIGFDVEVAVLDNDA